MRQTRESLIVGALLLPLTFVVPAMAGDEITAPEIGKDLTYACAGQNPLYRSFSMRIVGSEKDLLQVRTVIDGAEGSFEKYAWMLPTTLALKRDSGGRKSSMSGYEPLADVRKLESGQTYEAWVREVRSDRQLQWKYTVSISERKSATAKGFETQDVYLIRENRYAGTYSSDASYEYSPALRAIMRFSYRDNQGADTSCDLK